MNVDYITCDVKLDPNWGMYCIDLCDRVRGNDLSETVKSAYYVCQKLVLYTWD